MKMMIAMVILAISALAGVTEGSLYPDDALFFDLLIASSVPYPQCATIIYRRTDDGTLNYLSMWPENTNADDALIATFVAAGLTSKQTAWSSNRVYVVIVGDGMYSMTTSDARHLVDNAHVRGGDWALSYILSRIRYEGDL